MSGTVMELSAMLVARITLKKNTGMDSGTVGMEQRCTQNGIRTQTYLSLSNFRFQEYLVLLLTRDRGMERYHSQPESKQNGHLA